jgi:hypothetical protein
MQRHYKKKFHVSFNIKLFILGHDVKPMFTELMSNNIIYNKPFLLQLPIATALINGVMR